MTSRNSRHLTLRNFVVFTTLFLGFCGTVSGRPVDEEQLGSGPQDGHRLVYLSALWRHGDRAPSHTFAGDLYPESFWDNGFGQLTNLGILQQKTLGKWVHDRYVQGYKFLPHTFEPKQIKVRSTYYNRTRESALYNFKGMYGEQITYDDLNIFSIPADQRDLVGLPYYGCEYAKQLAAAVLRAKGAPEYMAKHKEWIKRLERASNMTVHDSLDLFDIPDSIYLEHKKHLNLSADYQDNFGEIFDIYLQSIRFMYGMGMESPHSLDWRHEMVRMQSGGLLRQLTADLRRRADCELDASSAACADTVRYRVFSMHDTNVLSVLHGFGYAKTDFNRNDNVELGSALFFELWRGRGDDLYVKVIYRRSAAEVYDLSPTIHDCKPLAHGLGCGLEQFLRRSDKFVVQDEAKYCAQKLPQEARAPAGLDRFKV